MTYNRRKFAAPYSSRFYSNAAASGTFSTHTQTGGTPGSNMVTVTVDVNDTAMGTVSLIKQKGTASDNGGSAQEVINRDGSKSITVERGSTVRVVAKAATGYVLKQFTGTPTPPSTNTAAFNVVANTNCSFHAEFRKVSTPTYHTLHVNWNRQMGNVRCSSQLDSEGNVRVNTGCTVTLTATPSQGYHFVRWDGCTIAGRPNQIRYDATITEQIFGDRTIQAVFAADSTGGGDNPGGGNDIHKEDPPTPVDPTDPTPGNNEIVDPTGNTLVAKATAFVKQWWWALAIVAYIIYKERKGGPK